MRTFGQDVILPLKPVCVSLTPPPTHKPPPFPSRPVLSLCNAEGIFPDGETDCCSVSAAPWLNHSTPVFLLLWLLYPSLTLSPCPLRVLSVFSPCSRPQWLRTDEVTQSGGTAIKIENPNQFVPLFTNPQEVLETRNKVHQHQSTDKKPFIQPSHFPLYF